MNERAKNDMFKQLVVQMQRDSVTSFDDIENFVRMYTIEYRRQLKYTNNPEVKMFSREEIKEKVHKYFNLPIDNNLLKCIKDNDQYFYSVYDLVTKFATTTHAITPSTLVEDIERIAGDEVFTFKTSNYNTAKYITREGVKKTNDLMKYKNFEFLWEHIRTA